MTSITLSDRSTGFIWSPVQLFFPHGKAQAFSVLTSSFCSPVLIWLLLLQVWESVTLVTSFSSFTKWLPKSFLITSFNSVESVRQVTLLKNVLFNCTDILVVKMRVVWGIMSSRMVSSYRLTGLPGSQDGGRTVHRNDGKCLPVDIT